MLRSEDLFDLEILSPEKSLFSDKVEMVIVPGKAGELGILANHTRLVSTIRPGLIRIKKEEREESFKIKEGIISVDKNRVIILAIPDEG